MSDKTDILALIDRHTAATRAKDAEAALADYAPDIVTYSLAPPLAYSGVDVEGTRAWYDTWPKGLGYETQGLQVEVSGDLAVVTGYLHVHGYKEGADQSVWSRLTLALRRADGRWAIFHEHASVPFYMDGSYRAATDLKPAA